MYWNNTEHEQNKSEYNCTQTDETRIKIVVERNMWKYNNNATIIYYVDLHSVCGEKPNTEIMNSSGNARPWHYWSPRWVRSILGKHVRPRCGCRTWPSGTLYIVKINNSICACTIKNRNIAIVHRGFHCYLHCGTHRAGKIYHKFISRFGRSIGRCKNRKRHGRIQPKRMHN